MNPISPNRIRSGSSSARAAVTFLVAATAATFTACQEGGDGAKVESAAHESGSSDSAGALATIGGRVITIKDFEWEISRRQARSQPIPKKEALLDEMIVRISEVVRAEEAGLADDREVRRLLDNVLIGQLRERELETGIQASDSSEAELRSIYQRDLDQFSVSPKIRLAILHLACPKGASEAKRAGVRAQIDEGRGKAIANPAPGGRGPGSGGFGAVAVRYSEDQVTRHRGGDVGWLDEGDFSYRWPRAVLERGYALNKGELSEVIETEDGFYVVMKTDAREGQTKPFEEVQAVLQHRLLAENRGSSESEFRAETARLAPAVINRNALAALQIPRAGDTGAPAIDHEPQPPSLPGVSATKPGN